MTAIEAAGVLRDLEIVTAVVTVGNKYDQEEVNAIASLPEYIFPVGDYTALNSFAKSLAKAVCEGKNVSSDNCFFMCYLEPLFYSAYRAILDLRKLPL